MTALKQNQPETISCEKTVYMEVVGENRSVYRVTSSKRKKHGGSEKVTYGVEAETKIGPIKFCEKIDDFSDDLYQAVGFTELLVENNIKPSLIYNAALCYLRKTI